jgi:hypothetical protein
MDNCQIRERKRSAIRNGRLLQDLINDAGVRYMRALKENTAPKSRR